jgi:hypothetical protein
LKEHPFKALDELIRDPPLHPIREDFQDRNLPVLGRKKIGPHIAGSPVWDG